MVRRALREAVREPRRGPAGVEAQRLDTLYATVMVIVETGTTNEVLHAIDRALRIMERRAKLLGLDAPMKQDLRVMDRLDAQIEQLAAELAFMEDLASVREEGPRVDVRSGA